MSGLAMQTKRDTTLVHNTLTSPQPLRIASTVVEIDV